MITADGIWNNYLDQLGVLFRALLSAKFEGDDAAAETIMKSIDRMADGYLSNDEPMVRALGERQEVLQQGYRVDN